MEFSVYLAFIVASFVLVVIPGPNVAVIVANSLKYGTKIGMVTVAGAAAGGVTQLVLVVFGLSILLENMGNALFYIKWAGVAYLIYIGYRTWNEPVANLSKAKADVPNSWRIFMRGIIVSLSNPKSLVFFGAFFPQFINPEQNITEQLILLSVTFMIIGTLTDSSWTVSASIAKKLLLKSEKIVNRVSGGFLMLSGGLLALIKEK